ncbi:MAG: hypothetical protein R3E01_01245 [Pirellulaceae bacterium]
MNFFRLIVLASFCAGVAGCARGPAKAPVKGTVTVNGQPITEGRVTFHPVKGRSASGRINADGTYELTTDEPGDGALVGEHTVTIEASKITSSAVQAQSFEEEISTRLPNATAQNTRIQWLVPPEYSEPSTSPLRETVEDVKLNTIDLAITKK